MLKIRVFGVPAPQGSKNATVGKDGKAHMYEQSAKKLTPWRKAVADASSLVMDGADPLDGPLFVDITFFMARPKSVKRDYPSVFPDLDKITRGVYDSLKKGGAIADDARIVEGHGRKVYAVDGDAQGCLIMVMTMDEWLKSGCPNGHTWIDDRFGVNLET